MKSWIVSLSLVVVVSATTAQALIRAGDIKTPPWVRGHGLNGYFPDPALRNATSGLAVIHCQADGAGKLSQCTVAGEAPKGYGFGEASKSVATVLTVDLAQAPVKDGAVDIPISYFARNVGDLAHPDWVAKPSSDDVAAALHAVGKDGAVGAASLKCDVSWAGRLDQCAVADQSAPGFGDAAVRLAPLFKLALLDDEGLPVLGRRVTVPFDFGAAP